jgi:hypothetical protein
MTVPTLMLVVLAKDQPELDAFKLETVRGVCTELVLVSNPNKQFGGLGLIANKYLDASSSEVFGIVHADTVFGGGKDEHSTESAIEIFSKEAANYSVSGMVGRCLDGRYLWSSDTGDDRNVSTLDSCSIFFRKDSGLRFDTAVFDDFHCCVEDICLQAMSRDIPRRVPRCYAEHNGIVNRSPSWMSTYWHYRGLLVNKWSDVSFATT